MSRAAAMVACLLLGGCGSEAGDPDDAMDGAGTGDDAGSGDSSEGDSDGDGGDETGDGDGTGDGGTDEPPTLCADEAELCSDNCASAPTVDPVAEWHNRLTESPTVRWSADGPVQVAVGSAPGETDYACWTSVDGDEFTFIDLFLTHGETYHFSVRALDAEGRVGDIASVSWTVDALAPTGIEAVVDDALPVDGSVQWDSAVDADSGLSGYRVAVGTEPLGNDVLDWVDANDAQAMLDLSGAAVGRYYASVRSVDVAGNTSNPVASGGFIVCPDDFAYVPGNDDDGIASPAFCVMRYEAHAVGVSDAINLGDDASATVNVAPEGTPWTGLSRNRATSACSDLGDGYGSLSNNQWQVVARSLEANPDNWSGGAVGSGAVPRGHSDGAPGSGLVVDTADPCAGTGQADCDNPASGDFSQLRRLYLANGDAVWDFAGNVDEWVLSSAGAPDVLWTEFSAAVFNMGEEASVYRSRFAPDGAYDSAQGMGQFYGGGTALARGGALGDGARAGIFGGMHNAWNTGGTRGFRCMYAP